MVADLDHGNLFQSMRKETYRILKHFIVILIALLSPIIIEQGEALCCEHILSFSVVLSYIIIFYLNYLFFIDKWLYKKETRYLYVFVNIVVVILFWLILEFGRDLHFRFHIQSTEYYYQLPPPPSKLLMAMKDVWMGMLVIGFSIALRVAENYFKLKEQTVELLRLKSEAELAQLKHQLNPHFLFNTLNNIYALIGISQTRAQSAVHDLSKLLRYALYEGNKEKVLLESELQFVRNYLELMSLRLSDTVKLQVNIPVDTSNLYIAPMLFITLVENAFKHGVVKSGNSFINIEIKAIDGVVECNISNSVSMLVNSITDKSGIGVENLKKRLNLIYPDRYSYEYTNKDSVYYAKLKIVLKDDKA